MSAPHPHAELTAIHAAEEVLTALTSSDRYPAARHYTVGKRYAEGEIVTANVFITSAGENVFSLGRWCESVPVSPSLQQKYEGATLFLAAPCEFGEWASASADDEPVSGGKRKADAMECEGCRMDMSLKFFENLSFGIGQIVTVTAFAFRNATSLHVLSYDSHLCYPPLDFHSIPNCDMTKVSVPTGAQTLLPFIALASTFSLEADRRLILGFEVENPHSSERFFHLLSRILPSTQRVPCTVETLQQARFCPLFNDEHVILDSLLTRQRGTFHFLDFSELVAGKMGQVGVSNLLFLRRVLEGHLPVITSSDTMNPVFEPFVNCAGCVCVLKGQGSLIPLDLFVTIKEEDLDFLDRLVSSSDGVTVLRTTLSEISLLSSINLDQNFSLEPDQLLSIFSAYTNVFSLKKIDKYTAMNLLATLFKFFSTFPLPIGYPSCDQDAFSTVAGLVGSILDKLQQDLLRISTQPLVK